MTEKKYIVSESSLDELLCKITCTECMASVDTTSVNKRQIGSGLCVKLVCENGHKIFDWTSQPLMGKMPSCNLLSVTATLLSGNTFARIAQYAKLLNLQLYSHTVHDEIQTKYLVPEVHRFWVMEQERVVQLLRQKESVSLIGDGRCDSPGYNAKYCTYSMMDAESELIASFELVQVTEAGSSVRMECIGFERCLDSLIEAEVPVNCVATDRHVMVWSLMKKKFAEKGVEHNFDVYHMANTMRKDVMAKSKTKDGKGLEMWLRSVLNQLWWSARTSGGDPDFLVEKFTSIVYHACNIHEWPDDTDFKYVHKCEHAPLDRRARRKKIWIEVDSDLHAALKKVVTRKRFLQDIRMLSKFLHTGALEVDHAMMLKYVPKRQHFAYPQMTARLELAALDHNANVGREQAKIKKANTASAEVGDLRYRTAYSKQTKQWVAKPIYIAKNYDYLEPIMEAVVQRKMVGETGKPYKPTCPNIAPVPKPAKHDLVATHRTRFDHDARSSTEL